MHVRTQVSLGAIDSPIVPESHSFQVLVDDSCNHPSTTSTPHHQDVDDSSSIVSLGMLEDVSRAGGGNLDADRSSTQDEEVESKTCSSPICALQEGSKPIMNRYLLLGLCLISGCFLGPSFINWPAFSEVLLTSHTYEYLCAADEAVPCPAQWKAMNSIMPLAHMALFTFTFVGGLAVDIFGPKSTALAGMTSMVVGWVLVGASSEHFNAYKPGMLLIGFGQHPTFFGFLCLPNLFPKWGSTVVSLLSLSRAFAFNIPVIMSAAAHRGILLDKISFFMAGMVFCLMGFVYVVIPWRPFQLLPSVVDNPGVSETVASREKSNLSSSLPLDIPNSDERKIPDNQVVSRIAKSTFKSKALVVAQGLKECWGLMQSTAFIAVLPYQAAFLIRTEFFGAAGKQQLEPMLNVYLMAANFALLGSPVFGILADRFNSIVNYVVLSSASFFSSVFMAAGLISGLPEGWRDTFIVLGIAFHWPTQCFSTGQLYCYFRQYFPHQHMGKLSGIVTMFAGLVAPCVTPMYNYALDNNAFALMNCITAGLMIGAFGCVGAIYMSIRRKTRSKVLIS